jgi:hypothetical protein
MMVNINRSAGLTITYMLPAGIAGDNLKKGGLWGKYLSTDELLKRDYAFILLPKPDRVYQIYTLRPPQSPRMEKM